MQEENDNASAQPATADNSAAPEQSAQTPPTNGTAESADATTMTAAAPQTEEETEDISYQAVQKDGQVTAIWEMQGRRHLRTIDPRSREGMEILRLFTAEQE